jgi:hypothetical protein
MVPRRGLELELKGGHDADRGLLRGKPVVMVGERHAPLWQYVSRLPEKGRRLHRCPQRARIPDPEAFALQNRLFLGTA